MDAYGTQRNPKSLKSFIARQPYKNLLHLHLPPYSPPWSAKLKLSALKKFLIIDLFLFVSFSGGLVKPRPNQPTEAPGNSRRPVSMSSRPVDSSSSPSVTAKSLSIQSNSKRSIPPVTSTEKKSESPGKFF